MPGANRQDARLPSLRLLIPQTPGQCDLPTTLRKEDVRKIDITPIAVFRTSRRRRDMKNIIVGALLGITLTLMTALTVIALAPPQIEMFEDGSYTLHADLPFSPAWGD
jgi:hypothetical protein